LDVDRAAGLGFDPLRSRLVNLELATENERLQFLAAVEERVTAAMRIEPPTSNPKLRAIHSSVMQSRLGWIKSIRSILE
jgi:hypothetical protein